jgi:hypothetical protein
MTRWVLGGIVSGLVIGLTLHWWATPAAPVVLPEPATSLVATPDFCTDNHTAWLQMVFEQAIAAKVAELRLAPGNYYVASPVRPPPLHRPLTVNLQGTTWHNALFEMSRREALIEWRH